MKTLKLFIYNILYFLGKIWGYCGLTIKRKRKIIFKFATIKTSRRDKRANQRFIDGVIGRSLYKNLIITFAATIAIGLSSCEHYDVYPDGEFPVESSPVVFLDLDTMVKFTLYSNRVPYIWKRQINGVWVQDTVKANNSVWYETFDSRNYNSGVGYFATMNTSGIYTDSLHITGEYKGRKSQMASPYHQSFAYVVLSDLGPK